MKFNLSKSKLSGYLQSILQIVPSKSTLPILSNILFEALDNKLKISATDLEVSITATFDCNVAKKGVAVLPARILFDIIKELPESEVTFEGTTSRVEIKVPRGSYKIACASADDFPKLPTVNIKKQISLDSNHLVTMIKKSTFACSTDETRPALNGVLWSTGGDRMNMVATDGHRLAKISVENKKLQGVAEDIIIPPKVLNVIPKFVGEGDGEIGIIFGEHNIIFNLGDIILTSRLIEGPYPNYEQVIPSESNKKIIISKDELAGAVRRVSILSNSLTHQVKFGVKNNNLTISTTNADVGGEGKEVIPCDYTGDALELGYNALYVSDILTKIEGDEVIVELSSAVAAGIVYSPSIPKEEFLCLIMPLRLAE
ncbi:MAG: DNA polymerase III subunit beta [candidate division Zixibacteria bacterium]|nr:DNA polymerase III subunit beta [candidate division Zixibacteria bacterium]